MWTRSSIQATFKEGVLVVAALAIINYASLLDDWWRDAAQLDDSTRLADTDRQLMRRIRRQLRPPSDGPLNLNRSDNVDPSQYGIPEFVLALTGNKTGGFFVECGAFDGEAMSNTLLLERRYGWTGLLLEPASQLFSQLTTRNRHTWLLNACISDRPYAYMAQFQELMFFGTLKDWRPAAVWSDVMHVQGGKFYGHDISERREYGVTCYPLAAVLAAIGRRSVDFFSLDVEGVEFGVITSIPWQELDIKIVVIETYMGSRHNPQLSGIVDFMEQNGYWAEPMLGDWLFVKKDAEFELAAVTKIRQLRQHKINSHQWKPIHTRDINATNYLIYSSWDSDSSMKEYKMDLEA